MFVVLLITTQIFFVTPLLAALAYWSPMTGFVTMLALCVGSWTMVTMQGIERHWSASSLDSLNYWNDYWRVGKMILLK